MVLNKKGQAVFYLLMIGFTMIILVLALAGPVRDQITNSRNGTTEYGTAGLDCSNESISNYNKSACVVTDLSLFYFVGGLLLIGGSVVASRLFFE